MMLRNVVSLVLYNKHITLLNMDEVRMCNNFIDHYNEVKELMSQDKVIRD